MTLGAMDLISHIDEVCRRIETLEPKVKALLPERDRRERLIREAKLLVEQFPDPASRPPLFGVLVGVKDIFRVDGFETRCGSKLPAALFDGKEAECVRALRNAGALILGKTVTTEFAYFEPGPTRNPRNIEHTPGGSSSGSAAAEAADFCPVALGTQTVGSVIRPAAFCGIVGFKPGFGRIPTAGVIPFSVSADHVGLFTKDVERMVPVAAVLCAGWKTVRGTGAAPTLGVPEGAFLEQASKEALAAFKGQLEKLQSAGMVVKRVAAIENIEEILKRHWRMCAAEMAEVHRDWFASHGKLYRPRTSQLIREGQSVTRDELVGLLAARLDLRKELERSMNDQGIDLWVSPAARGPAPRGIDSTGDPAMNLPWTHAGMPAITIPAGHASNGLPLGLQCVARYMNDERLLAWATRIEQTLRK